MPSVGEGGASAWRYRHTGPANLRGLLPISSNLVGMLVSERIGQFFLESEEGRDRLEFTEYGAGDSWVVLLHGQLMPRRMQQPLARALAAEGLHVVTLDLLGHGRSDRPADPLVYSMTAFAEQVVALLDHLGADQAVIGGTSLGANVSLEVADIAPERVRGLIVEMPVLDNAVEAGILAFAPLMFAARFLPFTVTGLRLRDPADPARDRAVLDRDRPRHPRPARRLDGRRRARPVLRPGGAVVEAPPRDRRAGPGRRSPRRPDPPGRRRRDAGRARCRTRRSSRPRASSSGASRPSGSTGSPRSSRCAAGPTRPASRRTGA